MPSDCVRPIALDRLVVFPETDDIEDKTSTQSVSALLGPDHPRYCEETEAFLSKM